MTRIIGGSVGGRRLKTPAGTATRPTSDRVREALFSAIESQLGTLAGRAVADLYAGSGAVGLEARSRGASAVTLVERNRPAAALIRANARALGLDAVEVVADSAEGWAAGPRQGRGFDVAFLDPPYSLADEAVADVLRLLAQSGWLVPDALVVLERSSRGPTWRWPAGWEEIRSRRYGETMLWYGRQV